MYKIRSRWNHQNSIKVEWNIGKRCNYDCSYCPSSIHDNFSPHLDIAVAKLVIDKLASLGKPIRLSFTGGEPCVHPNFEEILDYARRKNFWISVTTNGTRKDTWYAVQPVHQWVFSLHFEYDWQRVLETILNVNNKWHKDTLLVNVMAHHDKMDEVKEAVTILEIQEVSHNVRRIRWTEGDHDLFDDMRYNLTDLEWILKYPSTVKTNVVINEELHYHANDVIKLHLNKYKDWTCNAGLESLMINWDGEVHRATCRVGGSLGNIYEDTFVAPSDPVICTRDWCTCAADIPITKINEDNSNKPT